MKILLDENIDVRFKKLFPTHHEVHTVRDWKWTGIKNGALLKLLSENKFDCWIIADKNLSYQQNTSNLPCLIIVLDVYRNTLKHISLLLPTILSALENPPENNILIITE